MSRILWDREQGEKPSFNMGKSEKLRFNFVIKVKPKTLTGFIHATNNRHAWVEILKKVEALEASNNEVHEVQVTPAQVR